MPEGATGNNIAADRAAVELPVTTSGTTVNLLFVGHADFAMAAQHIIVDGAPIMVAGGLDSISLVQNDHKNGHRAADPQA